MINGQSLPLAAQSLSVVTAQHKLIGWPPQPRTETVKLIFGMQPYFNQTR